jgi:hypothetical protein
MSAMLSVFMLCLPGPAWSQPDALEESRSVRSLYDDCTGLNIDYCDGYLSGVANTLDQHVFGDSCVNGVCQRVSGKLDERGKLLVENLDNRIGLCMT